MPHPAKPDPLDGPAPVPARFLTWWFGLLAMGGVGFGLYADEHPFGSGILALPAVVFGACVAAALLTVRLLHARPLQHLISARSLAAGVVIAVVCYFLGVWFGANLMRSP
jgi:energy-converting hydrogenase Eha subunit C